MAKIYACVDTYCEAPTGMSLKHAADYTGGMICFIVRKCHQGFVRNLSL